MSLSIFRASCAGPEEKWRVLGSVHQWPLISELDGPNEGNSLTWQQVEVVTTRRWVVHVPQLQSSPVGSEYFGRPYIHRLVWNEQRGATGRLAIGRRTCKLWPFHV